MNVIIIATYDQLNVSLQHSSFIHDGIRKKRDEDRE